MGSRKAHTHTHTQSLSHYLVFLYHCLLSEYHLSETCGERNLEFGTIPNTSYSEALTDNFLLYHVLEHLEGWAFIYVYLFPIYHNIMFRDFFLFTAVTSVSKIVQVGAQ